MSDWFINQKIQEKEALIQRIESLHGVHTIEVVADLGVGTREYELIEINEEEYQ